MGLTTQTQATTTRDTKRILPVDVRKYQYGDLDHFVTIDGEWEREKFRQALDPLVGGDALVATYRGTVVGFLCYHHRFWKPGSHYRITRLAVLDGLRRRSVGSMLVSKLHLNAIHYDRGALVATVPLDLAHVGAAKFFQASGFQWADLLRDYPCDGRDAVRFKFQAEVWK